MDDFITESVPSLNQVEDEKSVEQKSIESHQKREDYHLASLVEHPGWQQIREQMLKDIENFKTFREINMAEYSNAELGEVVRTERMVADKLQGYLNKIDEAVRAVTSGRNEQT